MYSFQSINADADAATRSERALTGWLLWDSSFSSFLLFSIENEIMWKWALMFAVLDVIVK